MKKCLLILLMLITLVSCNSSAKPEYPYTINSKNVDMSGYKGVNSTNHNFKGIVVDELFNVIDNKSSGIFLLGRSNCPCCQTVTRYMNEVAKELGVTIYYMDVYDEDEPITDQATQEKLKEYMWDILSKDEEGNKTLYTPQLFSVINGKFVASQVCYDDIDFSDPPSDKQIENIKKAYRKIMEPFKE